MRRPAASQVATTTSTSSPTFTTSSGCWIGFIERSAVWMSPSMPGSSSMNAPNGCRRATLPLWRVPTAYFSFTASHGSTVAALRLSQSLPLVVDAKDLHVDLRARLEQVGQLGAAVVARLAHVDQPLDAAGVGERDEHAPRDDLAHDALVQRAGLDRRERLGARLPALLLEHLAAGHDDVAPLLRELGHAEVEPLAHEVVEVGAVAQIDVRRRREGAEAAEVDLEPALHRARSRTPRSTRRSASAASSARAAPDRAAPAPSTRRSMPSAHAGARHRRDELITLDGRLLIEDLATVEQPRRLPGDVDPDGSGR